MPTSWRWLSSEAIPSWSGRYLLNPDLPPPGELGPLLASGKVDYGAVPESARVLHVLSPFELGVPIGQVWPGWAHERGLRFCATVYDLIPLEHPHTYLNDVRQRLSYTARLEVLRAADALLTISPATSRSLAANLGIATRKMHMVGAGTAPRFAPAEDLEATRRLARGEVPGLGTRFVLYPGGQRRAEERRGAHRRLRPPARGLARGGPARRHRRAPAVDGEPLPTRGVPRGHRRPSPVPGVRDRGGDAPPLPSNRAVVLPFAHTKVTGSPSQRRWRAVRWRSSQT